MADEDKTVWVENLLNGDSVYRSDRAKDKYPMTPNGYEGSIIAVPEKVAKEGYFRRAISRGKIRLVSDDEMQQREASLEPVIDTDTNETDRIMKSVDEGASEVGARYSKKGLTDDGSERQSITARQVLSGASEKNPTVVRRSGGSPVAANDDEALSLEAVVTEPVHEGDWPSDTGV